MTEATLRVWRGDADGGAFVEYTVPTDEELAILPPETEREKSQEKKA